MAIRIPPNQIVNKYTSGREYMYVSTQEEYQGHYYELNGKTFAGKEFNTNNPEIIKLNSNKANPLLNNPNTSTYAKIKNTKLNNFIPSSYIFQKTNINEKYINRYFTQKINSTPYLIKEITKESYEEIKINPLYKSIIIRWNTIEDNVNELKIAETQMPGITVFLQNLNFDPLSDIDEYPEFINPLNPPSI